MRVDEGMGAEMVIMVNSQETNDLREECLGLVGQDEDDDGDDDDQAYLSPCF